MWDKRIDNAGTIDETEVHVLELETVNLEVSLLKGDADWITEVFEKHSGDALTSQKVVKGGLEQAKMVIIGQVAKMLDNDGKKLTEAMRHAHSDATAKRDALVGSA